MVNVGVLCTRVRVEEKQLLAAFADASLPAEQISPEPQPFPIPRVGLASSALNSAASTFDTNHRTPVIVDRMQNRTGGSAIVRNHRALGTFVIDSGIAATGNRLEVMHTLAAAGLPLPPALLALSEGAGIAAIDQTGYPSTIFPMQIGLSGIGLHDREIAEAILEHRDTLGGSAESVFIVQGGLYEEHDLIKAIVVDGMVIAYEGTCHHSDGLVGCERLAVAAASALNASFVGVTLAHSPGGLVIWDVRPTPDFRQSIPTGEESVAGAVAALAQRALEKSTARDLISRTALPTMIGANGLGNAIVLSA